jgi:hypothetical protein
MRRVLTVAALLAAAVCVQFPWRTGNQAAGIDFYQFWAGGQLARQVDNLYAKETRQERYQPFVQEAYNREGSNNLLVAARLRPEFEFFSTPFLYTAFALLPDRYDRALLIYRVLSLAALIGGVLLFARAAGLAWAGAGFVLAYVLSLFEAVKTEARVVNVNFVQLFAVGLAAWLLVGKERWRWIAGAAVLGIVTAFKPNLAPVIPLLLVYRLLARERARFLWEAIGAVAGVALAVVVSSAYFGGFDAWLEWLAAARELAGTLLPLDKGNVAMMLPIAQRWGSGTAYVVALVLFALASTAGLQPARVVGGRLEAGGTPRALALGLLIYLLSATLVWLHYLVLAIPAAVVLIAGRSWVKKSLGIVGLTLVGLDLWMLVFPIRFQDTQVIVIWIGLGVLFAGSLIRTVSPYAASEEADDPRRQRTRTRPSSSVRRS